MADEANEIRIEASLKGNIEDVYDALSTFPGVLLGKTKDSVILAYIEKKDLKGNPIEFFVLEFLRDGIVISYVIPEKVPPSVRKWSVIRKSISFLTKVAKFYNIDLESLLTLVEKTIVDMISLIPKDSKILYIENDKLKNKIAQMERKIVMLEREKQSLSDKVYEISSKYSECMAKLRRFETLSFPELRVKIIEWIREHGGEIDIDEFSKVYNVPPSRVEEVLDRLVKENYLRPE